MSKSRSDKLKEKVAMNVSFRLYKTVDDDIVNKLNLQIDKTEYIKALIREDMKKGEK